VTKINILNAYIKFGTKLFHLTLKKKKKENLNQIIGKMKKKVNLSP
jgi:translation initiation factor IF-1